MPTQSDPESPFVGAQLEALLGGRAPGTPTTTGRPTAAPADVSFPAPPGLNAAPAGRPPKPQAPKPMAPTAPMPSAPTPSAAGPGTLPESGAPQAEDEQMGGGPAAPVQPAIDAQRYREAVVQTRNRLGPVPSIFRHPSLGEMEVVPGGHNYNAFTGLWTEPDEGNL